MLVNAHGEVDRLSMLGLCFTVVSVVLYHHTVRAHFRTYVDYQLQILSLRVAMIIPVYSILTCIMLIQPELAFIFETIAVFCEGYCIYCYFALIVVYCGGRKRVVDLIKESTHTAPCYASCQQGTPQGCFSTINALLIQFIFVRPLFTLIYGLADPKQAQLFRILGVVSLIIAMLGLLRIYHILAEHAKEMDATTKIVFIKILIIVLALEDVILNAIWATGNLDNTHKYGNYSKEEQEVRLYAIITLTEFFVASLLSLKFFHPARVGTDVEYDPNVDTSNLSYSQFIKDLLEFRYVFNPPPGFGKLQIKTLPGDNPLETDTLHDSNL